MFIEIDNVKKENFEWFDYPNKEIKKITLNNVNSKSVKIEFDDSEKLKLFILELMQNNYITIDEIKDYFIWLVIYRLKDSKVI